LHLHSFPTRRSSDLLAVSLHSAIDEVRTSIMPFNENFPLADLREALEYWYAKTKNRITYEYVVWKDINDKKKDVDALIAFCKFRSEEHTSELQSREN